MYKAIEAIVYLHENNVYYGDMKEANLLVFRDYQVKLGDFGVSLKLDPETDADEKAYMLKGATPGYTTLELDTLYSKNELYRNDYYALKVTFNKIKERVESIRESAGGFRKLVSFGFRSNTYFTQLLDEFEHLDPKKTTLKDILVKYRDTVSKDGVFFNTLINQLVTDGKIYSIPNVLKLW